MLTSPMESYLKMHSLVVGAIRGLRGFQVPPWLRPRLKKTMVPLTDRLAQMYIYHVRDVLATNVYWKGIQSSFTCHKLDQYIDDQHQRAYFHALMMNVLRDKTFADLCAQYSKMLGRLQDSSL